MALFKPGESGNPSGRVKGSGKSKLFREWCEEKGLGILFDIAEGKTKIKKTIIVFEKVTETEVWPDQWLRFEALKLAMAYGLGRPIVPFRVDDRARDPEESRKRADEVLAMMKELENNGTNAGTETGASGSGVGDRSAPVQAPA